MPPKRPWALRERRPVSDVQEHQTSADARRRHARRHMDDAVITKLERLEQELAGSDAQAGRAGPADRYAAAAMKAVILADDALAPLDRLWRDAVEHLARKLGRVVPLDPADVPSDRAAAVAHLDDWAGRDAGNWRVEVARFYEDHIPVYLRPDPELNATLRRLAGEGVRVGAWSPGPPEAMAVVTHFLGLDRRLDLLIVDPDPAMALKAARDAGVLPGDTLVVSASGGLIDAGRATGAGTVAALWTGADPDNLAAAAPDRMAARPADLSII
jgi:phosphoglycolate phosphatase-like HAD superfamily hydrolase